LNIGLIQTNNNAITAGIIGFYGENDSFRRKFRSEARVKRENALKVYAIKAVLLGGQNDSTLIR
jgi:hypothetical protein